MQRCHEILGASCHIVGLQGIYLQGSACDRAGIELASSCTRVTTDRGKALMFITVAGGSALGNSAYGALAGERSC